MIEKRTCSLCGAQNKLKIKYVLPEFNVLQCQKCGLLTRGTVFDSEEVKKIYSQDYFCKLQKDYFSAGISQGLGSSLRVDDFKNRLKKISQYTKLPKGKILDVGSATGVFLKISKDKGWETTGVEVSKYAATFSAKKFHLKVFCGELQNAKFKNNHFDVVTGWDLIEHVEEPAKLVKEIKRILKPKGYIALQTTMTDSLLFLVADLVYKLTFGKVSKLAQMAYPVHHSNHFSRNTLKKLLQDNGFKIIAKENVEMFYEETSLPKVTLPLLKIFGLFSRFTGKTIELFIIGQKQ